MLIEEVPCRTHADEDCAAVAVVKDGGNVVEGSPAGDHVVLVTVVFDMRYAAGLIGFTRFSLRGEEGEEGVVEVGRCGAKGVDLLFLQMISVSSTE